MIYFFRSDYDKLMPDSDTDERHYRLRDFALRNLSFSNTVQWPSLCVDLIFFPGLFAAATYSGDFSMMPVRILIMASPAALGMLAGYGLHRFTWPHNQKKFIAYLDQLKSNND